MIDGKKWVYNTVEDWQKQLPYFSVSQIRRALNHLREEGILIAKKMYKHNRDHKLWYTLGDERLQEKGIALSIHRKSDENRFVKFGKSYKEQDITKQNIKTPHTPLETLEEEEGCVGIDLEENQKSDLENLISLEAADRKAEAVRSTSQEHTNLSPQTTSPNPTQGEGDASMTVQELIAVWNRHSVMTYTKQPGYFMKQRLHKAFIKEFQSKKALWERFCQEVATNDFLSGKTSKIGWKADLEWCIRPNHLEKIFTGAYGIDASTFRDVDATLSEQDLETTIKQSQEAAQVKNIRLALLNHFGAPTYVSWFQDTPIEIDENGNVGIGAKGSFKRYRIAQLMSQVPWATALKKYPGAVA